MENNLEAIVALFDRWNEALQSGNPDNMLPLYAEDAILLPTLSNQVRHNHAEIRDYFVDFMKKKPVGEIVEANPRSFGEITINSGIYTFLLTQPDGEQQKARVRYSYVYRLLDGDWKIVEHHSSLMPEAE